MFKYFQKNLTIVILAGSFILSFSACPVFADEATNSETGSDSVNNSTEETNNQTEINNNNLTILSNEFYVQANTGDNVTSFNTGSGLVTTNKAKGQGEIINIINRNQTGYNPESDLGDLNASNEDTGAGSENNSQIIYSDNIVVRNINESETGNIINADINSGRNKANYNTGHGIVLSGEANLGLDVITLANTNIFGSQTIQTETLSVFENYSGDITFSQGVSPELSQVFASASNENTGADSENNASVEVDQNVEIYNKNIALLENEVELNVVSGQNEASANSGSGAASSSDVNVAFNMVNFLNTNVTSSNWWFSSLNVFGDWDGDVVLPQMIAQGNNLIVSAESENEETGAGSENTSNAEVENSFDLENNNEAEITNNVELNSQTGDNKTSFNTGTGSGEFGETDSETNTINLANINVTGDSWWLVIVNTFGSWQGTAIGSPSDMEISAGQNAIILSPANSGIEARNSSTGPDSDNNASVEINHSTNIENDNEATINNAIVINATTGENETKHNTGHGYVDTGNIKAAANLINIANSNIAVGNWLLAVVNVFGDWTGNIRFPDGMSGASLSNDSEVLANGVGDSSASNSSTGADSENNSSNTTNNTTEVNNTNTAEVNNSIGSSSTSGENEASYNTGSGVVTTGDAYTEANLTNQINNNETDVNNSSGSDGTSSAGNENTGADSENNSSNTTNNNNEINNNNTITADNNFNVSTSTGDNTANYNTGDGNVDTGLSSTILELLNDFNNNGTSVSSASAGSSGTDTENSDTGTGSENNSSTENNNNNQVSNDNETNFENNVNIDNSTGGNSADYNLGMGEVNTGDGQTSGSMENSANQNQTGSSNNSGDSNNSSGENSPSGSSGNNPPASNSPGGSAPSGNSSNTSGNSSGSSNSSGGSDNSSGIVKGIEHILGDLNGDGKVDDYDFSILMANWGDFFTDPRADANGDGKVDDYDFSIVMGNWGKTTALACK